MIRLLLVDYGEVISTPLPEDTITDLAALAGQPRAIFLDRYWQHRPAYDLGQPPAEYWSEVLARDLSRSPRVVDRLTDIDVHGWLRPNPLTLPTLLRRVRRTGIQLALLSNAPEPIAQAMPGGTGLKAAPQPGFMALPRACPRSLRPAARIRAAANTLATIPALGGGQQLLRGRCLTTAWQRGRIRREHGLSQEMLAEVTAISLTTVGSLGRQDRPSCGGRTLARLAAALDQVPADLRADDRAAGC